ncbi:MAG: DUF2917 domain-containing protein [Rhodocyclaceae bacterium]|nr:DUF2917 domain-containing protein [Rhodocyclaceae bacterium]
MAKIVQETRIEMAARELLALGCIGDHELACNSGELWITVDGMQEDIILGPGERWRVTGNTPVVVSALKPSLLVTTDSRRSGHARRAVHQDACAGGVDPGKAAALASSGADGDPRDDAALRRASMVHHAHLRSLPSRGRMSPSGRRRRSSAGSMRRAHCGGRKSASRPRSAQGRATD